MIKSFLIVKHISYLLIRVALLLFITYHATTSCFGQNMPVPENIQAALLPKVLKFSPNLSQVPKLRMLIVYDNSSQISKDELIKGFDSSINVKAINATELEQNIGNCDLVYFMPGMQRSARICKYNKVLSVTGISQYVEQGLISVAFGIQNNKPKIYVNLSSLEKEGQSLSSDLLRIAKVYN